MLKYKRVWFIVALLVASSLACSLSAADRDETRDSRQVTPVLSIKPTLDLTPTPLSEKLVIDADAEEQLLINIYERVNPAVVNIDVAVDTLGESSDFGAGSGFVIGAKVTFENGEGRAPKASKVKVENGSTIKANVSAKGVVPS